MKTITTYEYVLASRGPSECELFTRNEKIGFECSMVLPVSIDRLNQYLQGWDTRLIQHQFPDLDQTQREFLITGIDEARQIELYGPQEDEDDQDDDDQDQRYV